MTLTDGRGELYQWDTGRTLTVDDATVTQVHFQNRAYGRTINVDVNNGAAVIPDELLQKPGELRVYAFSGTAESGFTKVERVFNVVRRNKPNDYMFTPTEQKSLEGLQKQIGDLSDLKTAAKTDIVAAINETATAGQTLGLTGATVGQTVKIKSVDVDGKPAEWEAVELPSGAYIVNLTMGDDGSITADKTFAEIKAASDDGKVVNAKFADAIVPLCSLIDSDAIFAMTNANSDGVFTGRFICTSANVWSMSQNGFDAHTLGISGASVGQTVKIKTVDASGKPTAWEAADAASGEDEWIQLCDVELTEATNAIMQTWVDTPMRKIKVSLTTLAASANTSYMPARVFTEPGTTVTRYATFYPTALPIKSEKIVEYIAEAYNVSGNVHVRFTEHYGGIYGNKSGSTGGVVRIENVKSAESTGNDPYGNGLYEQIIGFSVQTYGTFEVGTKLKIWGVAL